MAEWLGVAGKRVVITGATSGIGLAAAEALAALGARLTIVARNEAKASHAAARIQAAGRGATADVLLADLASQASVRRLGPRCSTAIREWTSWSTMPAPSTAGAG